MKNREIRVFEHETLRIGGEDNELNENEFESLCRFYEEVDKRYFSLERRKIKFKHYVGVIQVGNLTIEVLPKVDKGQEDPNKWHDALVKMLQYTQKIRSFSTTESNLSISKHSLLDLYFDQFMHEVDKLFKDGLRKKYSFRENNLNKLKGRIVFNSHIKKNIVNKNKTYCKYQAFDFDHDLHSTIKMALRITREIARNSGLNTKAKKLLLTLPDEIRDSISITKLNQIKLDRTTKRYQKALNLASLIIQSYCPIYTAGRMSVLAFMFDMNHLFEEFLFKIMKKGFVGSEFDVSRRNKKFWENKIIKPDIVVTNSEKTTVLDAKWKVPSDGIPSDNDLKQIFAYNNYFESPVSYLLYPDTAIFSESRYDEREGAYQKDLFNENGTVPHYCKIRTVKFFNSRDQLDITGIKETLVELIENEVNVSNVCLEN